MNISIQVVAESDHRPCASGGDWFFDEDGDLQVRVSKMSNWRRETILALHEVCEAVLCKHNGVLQEQVDRYDAEYMKRSPETFMNAGDSPQAPYAREHGFASSVERLMATEMDTNWSDYEHELESI